MLSNGIGIGIGIGVIFIKWRFHLSAMAAGSSGEVEVHREEVDARKGKALCEECSTAEAKYTCPACGEKTCR